MTLTKINKRSRIALKRLNKALESKAQLNIEIYNPDAKFIMDITQRVFTTIICASNTSVSNTKDVYIDIAHNMLDGLETYLDERHHMKKALITEIYMLKGWHARNIIAFQSDTDNTNQALDENSDTLNLWYYLRALIKSKHAIDMHTFEYVRTETIKVINAILQFNKISKKHLKSRRTASYQEQKLIILEATWTLREHLKQYEYQN